MGHDEVFIPFAVAAITPLGCAWVASRFVPPTNKWVYGGVVIGTAYLTWKYIVPRMLTSMGYPVPFEAETKYCEECSYREHDACPMIEGCPCCDETIDALEYQAESFGADWDEDGYAEKQAVYLRRLVEGAMRNGCWTNQESMEIVEEASDLGMSIVESDYFRNREAESFSAEGDSGEVYALKKALKAYKGTLEDCLDGRYGTDDAESVMDDLEDSHHIVRFLGAESKFIRPYDGKHGIKLERDNKGRYRRKLSVPLKKR